MRISNINVIKDSRSVFLEPGTGDELYRIGNDLQMISVMKINEGLAVITNIWQNGQWIPFFDAGLSLIQGEHFNAFPENTSILTDTESVKTLKLSGQKTNLYSFDIFITVQSDSPLISVRIINHLLSNLFVADYEPVSMLWMSRIPNDIVTVYQETPNYQTLGDTMYWNSAFPYAYIWANGLESAVFFDMSAMDWFSFNDGVNRFKSTQVRSSTRNDQLGAGMDLRRPMGLGTMIASGDMIVDFYLYGCDRSIKPTKLEALDTAVNIFGLCFPAVSSLIAHDYVADDAPTYRYYTQKIAEQLMLEDITYRITPYNRLRNSIIDAVPGVWKDGPLFEETEIIDMLRRPDYAVGNLNGHNERYPDDIYGDWNCVNNTLVPWIAFERLFPNAIQNKMIDLGVKALKVYYDPIAKLVRSFECSEDFQNAGVEFDFQNFFFSINTLKAAQLQNPDNYDPALAGKYLMGLEGLIELAHNVSYMFPQLFSAREKIAAISLDEAFLGKPYDVWTGAVYAYNMCMAYDWINDIRYLNEAVNTVDALFEGMQFTVENSIYSAVFSDPYDFPVNEVSSAPWGVAASQWLYKKTREEKYIKYGAYFRDITLRLMGWYESALRDDPIDKSVPGLGLFHDFSVADTPSAWENIMTYLPLLMELKNEDIEPNMLLVKMFNVYRTNAFYMHGPTWDPKIIGIFATNFTSHPAGYMAVEDFYTAETPTPMGLSGPTVYMSNSSFYAFFLYEAFAQTDNKDIMALNLDYVDNPNSMLEGIDRHFIFFNPLDVDENVIASFSFLIKSENYLVTVSDETGVIQQNELSEAQLSEGIPLQIARSSAVRVNLSLTSGNERQIFEARATAQQKLSRTYQLLQEAARDLGVNEALLAQKAEYLRIVSLYNSKDYVAASTAADMLLPNIPQYVPDATDILNPKDISPWTQGSDANLAFGAYTSVSTGIGARVVDGKFGPDNTWVTNPADNHYIIIDFGSSLVFGRYRIYHNSGNETTASFVMMSSDDKANWVLRDSVINNTSEITGRAFAPFQARYVKIVVTKPDQIGGNIARIQEIEFFAGEAGTNPFNLAPNAALSSQTGNPDLATDGIVSQESMWETEVDGTLIADFSTPVEIGRYVIKHAGLANLPEKNAAGFELSSSDDGLNWTLIDSVTDNILPLSKSEESVLYQLADNQIEYDLGSYDSAEGGMTVDITHLLRVIGKNEQNLKKRVSVDLNSTPILEINFREMDDGQSVLIQVWDEIDNPIFITDAPIATGSYTFDLPSIVGWSGTKQFEIIIYPQSSTSLTFDITGLRALPASSGTPVDLDHLTYDAVEGGLNAYVAGSLHVTGQNGQNLKKKIEMDLDSTPLLEIQFSGIEAGQSVHMQAWDEINSPIFLIDAAIAADGTYLVDIPSKTGWGGVKQFYVIFYPQSSAPLSFDIARLRALSSTTGPGTGSIDDDFSDLSIWRFSENATINKADSGSGVIIKCIGGSFGYVGKMASVNIDETPLLRITVPEIPVGSHFHIMLNDGDGDIFMSRTEITTPGVYYFDLPVITGWTGDKEVMVKLAVIGGNGAYVIVQELSTWSGPLSQYLTDREVNPFTARYARLMITKPGSGGTAGVCEFELYAPGFPTYETLSTDGQTAFITTGKFISAFAARNVAYDISAYPLLEIDVIGVTAGANWQLELRDASGGSPITLTPPEQTGLITFDLANATTWRGIHGYNLRIVLKGGSNKQLEIAYIKANTINR